MISFYFAECMKRLMFWLAVVWSAAGCTATDESPDRGNVEIPDPVFRAYCLRRFDRNGDGVLSEAEARMVRSVDCRETDVASLVGIERFSNLDSLICMGCRSLRELDVSANRSLRVLICHDCDLRSLDLTYNPALEKLGCGWNPRLLVLNVSRNPRLTLLSCRNLNLLNLNVSRNLRLDTLICGDNRFFSLDVTRNRELLWLDVSRGWRFLSTEELDVSHCPKLRRLDCENVRSLVLRRGQVIPEMYVIGCRIRYRD